MAEYAIAELPLGNGWLGISAMPGRTGFYQNDLNTILRWDPDLVLSMTQEIELKYADAATFGEDLQAAGITWHHLPIPDMGAPPVRVQVQWQDTSVRAAALLDTGGRILAHCYGGCGRSGLAVLRLMVEAGEDVDAALARLRSVRPCAVETEEQKDWAALGAR